MFTLYLAPAADNALHVVFKFVVFAGQANLSNLVRKPGNNDKKNKLIKKKKAMGIFQDLRREPSKISVRLDFLECVQISIFIKNANK